MGGRVGANFKTCIGYQTVSYVGEIQDLCKPPLHLAKSVSFNSDLRGFQWLTTGYYFWMNSMIPAEKWMKLKEEREKRLDKDITLGESSRYLIVKYEISIERDRVFDLIENPDDEKYLFELLDAYCLLYNESVKLGFGNELHKPSISVVLHYFRERQPDIFPYEAITIADKYCSSEYWKYYNDEERKSYLKILPLRAKGEEYKGVGRPQICVFEGLEDTLKNPELMYPVEHSQILE